MSTRELLLLSEVREAVRTGRCVEVREAAGLTQGELARALDVAPATVSRWEAGQRLPSGQAIRYARLLRVLAERAQAVVA